MKLVVAPEALADIDEIYRYIAAQSPTTADRVDAAIRKACEACAAAPFLYPATRNKSVRRYPLKRHGFTIFYRVDKSRDQIDVLRALRGRRVKSLGTVPRG